MCVCVCVSGEVTREPGYVAKILLYPILINLQQYGLGPEIFLNFLPRTPEKPEKLTFCH